MPAGAAFDDDEIAGLEVADPRLLIDYVINFRPIAPD